MSLKPHMLNCVVFAHDSLFPLAIKIKVFLYELLEGIRMQLLIYLLFNLLLDLFKWKMLLVYMGLKTAKWNTKQATEYWRNCFIFIRTNVKLDSSINYNSLIICILKDMNLFSEVFLIHKHIMLHLEL